MRPPHRRGESTESLFTSVLGVDLADYLEPGSASQQLIRRTVAELAELPPDAIEVRVDTSYELDTGITTASRATMLGGRAVLQACEKLRKEMVTRRCRMDDLAGESFKAEVLVDWTTKLGDDVEEPITHFGYGWVFPHANGFAVGIGGLARDIGDCD